MATTTRPEVTARPIVSAPPAALPSNLGDVDPQETADWLASLDAVIQNRGAGRARYLLARLVERAHAAGAAPAYTANTPYINTISLDRQPEYPGDRMIERRIKSLVRWNAMAMVVRANKKHDGLGGHISTYASAATLYEVG